MAARDFRTRCSMSGTLRSCTIFDMHIAYLHVHHMSTTLDLQPSLTGLNVFEEFLPWIFRIQLCQLTQEFLCLFIARHRDGDLHLDDFVSADALFRCRWHALFAKT